VSELDDRVGRLERDMAEVRRDVAAARILAGGAHEDVANMRIELRAHTKTLEALRETQLEQGQAIRVLHETQVEQGREMRAGFARVDAEARQNYTTLNHGMAQITALLNVILEKIDKDEPAG
jgi:hypothetical protein